MAAPYDTIQQVLNLARVRLNDAIQSINGEVLTNNAPFTLPAVNGAWRRLQSILVANGFFRLKNERVFSSVPAITVSAPGTLAYIGWDGYFDGTTVQASPVLPVDFIEPLECWEQPSGTTGGFGIMDRFWNGLPAIPKRAWLSSWEWRNDRLYLIGATVSTDIRVRYAAFLADFTDPAVSPAQSVPILRSLSPFAWFLCSEIAGARGDLDGKAFDDKAIAEAAFIYQLDSAQPENAAKTAELQKMVDGYSKEAA